MEFEWQQVTLRLQNSFQYSDQPQQCCSLDNSSSSSDFQLFQSPYPAAGDSSKWGQLQLVSSLLTFFFAFLILWRGQGTFCLHSFLVWSTGTAKCIILQVFWVFLMITKSGPLVGIRWLACILKFKSIIIINIILLFWEFFTQRLLMISQLSFSDSKSP